jgi:hypothetical protein
MDNKYIYILGHGPGTDYYRYFETYSIDQYEYELRRARRTLDEIHTRWIGRESEIPVYEKEIKRLNILIDEGRQILREKAMVKSRSRNLTEIIVACTFGICLGVIIGYSIFAC